MKLLMSINRIPLSKEFSKEDGIIVLKLLRRVACAQEKSHHFECRLGGLVQLLYSSFLTSQNWHRQGLDGHGHILVKTATHCVYNIGPLD